MKIAIVETAPFGGLLHYAAQLADGLASRGHEVDLIAPRGHELRGRVETARDCGVLVPPVRSSQPSPRDPIRSTLKRIGVAGRLTIAWLQIIGRVARGRYDAVLVNASYDVSIAAGGLLALAALPTRTAVTHVCHNVSIFNRWAGDQRFGGSKVLLELTRRAHSKVDLTFVHGEQSRREFVQRWDREPTIIPHGDERVFAADPVEPSSEENILFFGHWNRVKGIPLLQAAFDIVAANRDDATLTLAGTPNALEVDVPAIKRWAEEHGPRVELIDRYVPMDDVREIFARARVVVTPYYAGYQSGIIHLAMTFGRPVVATDVGDLGSAVVDGTTGTVVPPEDEVALAAALEELLSDPARAALMGEAGRERVMSASAWEEVAEQVEAALRPLVRR
jgi:glycosyltransferase involved in cell wall biosynthesis